MAIINKFKLKRSKNLLKEYTEFSTIHGVQHIFRKGESFLHRTIWAALFAICFVWASQLIWYSWKKYVQNPVEITVTDTLHTLNGELFPAITVCPVNKLIISKAKDYLERNLNKELLNESKIIDYLNTLVLFHYPVFYQKQYFFNRSQPILFELPNINSTELMLKSMPNCEDIFVNCWWRGKPTKCCNSMFYLQRSEEGFCYSFNSLTSEKFRHCTYWDAQTNKPGCRLKRNRSGASGPTTGAEIFIKINTTVQSTPKNLYLHQKAVKIQAHHPFELPEPGKGVLLPIDSLNKADMAIKVTITESTDEIMRLKLQDRQCLFKSEKNLTITRIYSQKSCLIECRLKYFIKKCQCLPYYFNIYYNYKEKNLPICNSTKLKCIFNSNGNLRFFKPPNSNSELFVSHNMVDCTHCLPTCNDVSYEITSEMTKDFYTKKMQFDGYLDVYYKSTGSVRYQRDVTYNHITLLVNLGGIGGLFLGGSLLSLVEILFWFSKALFVHVYPTKNQILLKKKRHSRANIVHAWIK